jgi:hypothetical protein
MTRLDLILSSLMLGFEIILFSLVYVRRLQRRLPFFAAYTTSLLIGMPVALLIYYHFGFRSATSYFAAWIMIGLQTFTRSLAVAELCRYGLRAYRGIWALTWRALIVLAVFLVAHATVDAWGQPNRIAIYGLTIERDADISAVAILAVLLLIRNYYGFSPDALSRSIAAGILFLCAADIVNNTMVRDLFAGPLFSWFSSGQAVLWPALRPQIERVNELWNFIRFSSFMVSMGIWCFALRKPLPAPAKDPGLLPASVYEEFSPALNLNLRAFNDRLQELLKL